MALRCTTVVHVLTTATIDRLRERYPEQRFEVRRFSPKYRGGGGVRASEFCRERLDRGTFGIE